MSRCRFFNWECGIDCPSLQAIPTGKIQPPRKNVEWSKEQIPLASECIPKANLIITSFVCDKDRSVQFSA